MLVLLFLLYFVVTVAVAVTVAISVTGAGAVAGAVAVIFRITGGVLLRLLSKYIFVFVDCGCCDGATVLFYC